MGTAEFLLLSIKFVLQSWISNLQARYFEFSGLIVDTVMNTQDQHPLMQFV